MEGEFVPASQESSFGSHTGEGQPETGKAVVVPEFQARQNATTRDSFTDSVDSHAASGEQDGLLCQRSSGRESERILDDSGSTWSGQNQLEPSIASHASAARREAWVAATCDGSLALGVGNSSLLSSWMVKKETAQLGAEFVSVPCRPLVELFGMSFLCPSAQEEVEKGLRDDVLVPSDIVQLLLFQASALSQQGKVNIEFPPFISTDIVEGLEKNPIGVDLGSLCPYFFEVGLKLCDVLAEDQWPLPGLRRKLREAQRKRLVHIVSKVDQLSAEALQGLTHVERCKVRELQRSQSQRLLPFHC